MLRRGESDGAAPAAEHWIVTVFSAYKASFRREGARGTAEGRAATPLTALGRASINRRING